jgi:hypothetical protein
MEFIYVVNQFPLDTADCPGRLILYSFLIWTTLREGGDDNFIVMGLEK